MHRWQLKTGWALALLIGLAPAAWAQVSTGNIYGKVIDESQAVLPGATATLTGPLGTRTTTRTAQGEFRFLNIDHGTHKLVVTLSGFAGVSRDVIVSVGQNVNVSFGLKVAPVEETVIVTDETPVVDTKKLGTNTTITKAELAQVPSSRDPWALMRTIPGVLVDRVNVAGSESGQQSQFAAKGADPKDAVWSIDGIVTTDMAAVGSSPDYYSLRRVRRGQLLDGRQQHRDRDRRHRHRHRDQARHQRVPRQRAAATSRTTTCSGRTSRTSSWATRACRATTRPTTPSRSPT